MMENVNLNTRNTNFLKDHFFGTGARFYNFGKGENVRVEAKRIDQLNELIKIIEGEQYSKPLFKEWVFNFGAPEFWKDPYYLEFYDKSRKIIENSIQLKQSNFENDPDNDDVLLKHDFDLKMNRLRADLGNLDQIIELTIKFRDLINEAFPGIEDKFKQLLQEHNDLQEKEAARGEAIKNERKKRIEAKQKQGEKKRQHLTIDESKIKSIIQEMFPTGNDKEIESLINHLNGETGYMKITYTGAKKKLWEQLKSIRKTGIDRKMIANVFSTCCSYQKTRTATPAELKYDEIHKKI